MKVTRLGYPRPVMSLATYLGSGPDGQVPTANGSNSVAWGSNVAIITSNGSNALQGPFVNFASGSNTIFSVSSNTLTIAAVATASAITVEDEGTPLSTDASILNFVGAGVVASGAGATKTITITGTGGGGGSGSVPTGFIQGDEYPVSPGAEDEEFEGTADTLPSADWSWIATPASWSLNSSYPSLWVWERAAGNTTEYKARIANFNMAATSGLWVRMGVGVAFGSVGQWEWIIYDSASSNGYGAGIHNGNIAVARDSNAGVLANRGTFQMSVTTTPGFIYLGVMRVSNTWATFVSFDGVHWTMIQSADTRSFTVDRLEFRWSTDAGGFSGTWLSRASVDWIRYRTDNLFPRP